MARAVHLQVYVTPAGFYDAVVAAPNQKAALRAWGAHADLFGQKLATLERDEAWRDKALASPGEVLKKPRGDSAELMARRTPPRPRRSTSRQPQPAPVSTPEPRSLPAPPPSRAKLDAAEVALAKVRAEADEVRADFAHRREELDTAERGANEQAQAAITRAEAIRKREASAFVRASR